MKKLLIIFAVFILAAPLFGQWWEYGGEMPRPVAGGEAVVVGDYIYVLGGYSDSTQSNVNWIQRYNPETNEWQIVGEMLQERFGFAAGVYNNNIAMFGGIEDTTNIVNSLEVWNNLDFSATFATRSSPAFNRIFPAGILDGVNLYIFGGTPYPNSEEKNFRYISGYNISDSSIVYQSDSTLFAGEFPEQQMAAKIGDKIYLFGGVFFGVSQSAFQFDLATKIFRESKSQLQTPRANGKAVYADESIFLIGGYNESSAALYEVERINLEDSTFTAFNDAPLNYPRRNLMAVNFKGRIFAFGGFNRDGDVVREFEYYYPQNVTSAEEMESANFEDVKVYQNYPNPFNPETVIRFEIPSNGSHYGKQVELKVYDVLGNQITTLVDEEKAPGVHEVNFDARKYSSGVYFYQLKSDYKTFTKKMIIAK